MTLLEKIESLNTKKLTEFDLFNTIINSQEDVLSLAESLKDNKQLRTLDLTGYTEEVSALPLLIPVFATLINLEKLDLSFSEIKTESIILLSEFLQKNSSLKKLNLSFNMAKMAKEDFVNMGALAECLKTNKTLTHLNLSLTSMHDEGAKNFARSLRINKTLLTLDLSGNPIGEEALKELKDALEGNTTLIKLKFSDYGIRNKLLIQEIHALLERNKMKAQNEQKLPFFADIDADAGTKYQDAISINARLTPRL